MQLFSVNFLTRLAKIDIWKPKMLIKCFNMLLFVDDRFMVFLLDVGDLPDFLRQFTSVAASDKNDLK